MVGDNQAIACPADGKISQIGAIKDGRIIQAKNRDYTVLELSFGTLLFNEKRLLFCLFSKVRENRRIVSYK